MALYHLHCDVVGRSAGKSAVGSVAYQFRMNCIDESTGDKLYYSKKKDKAVRVGFDSPDNCNELFICKNKKDVANFWNMVQKKENRKNSQFARDFDIALQSELTIEQNCECVAKWIYENYTKRGLCSSWAVHRPHENPDGTNNKNWHVHIMVALRKVDENGWAEKDRDGNDREFLKKIRKSWADIVNTKFKELGINQHIDERTLEEQGIYRTPQQHNGPKKTAIMRKTQKPTTQKNPEHTEIKQIEISENEIISELKNDSEYRRLQNLRNQILDEIEKEKIEKQKISAEEKKAEEKIINMTPKQWQDFMRGYGKNWVYEACGEFEKNNRDNFKKATVIYVEKNYPDVRKYFYDWAISQIQEMKNFKKENPKPWGDAQCEKKFFGGENWTTSDGRNWGDDPSSARMHQQSLNNRWAEKIKPIKQKSDNAKKQWADVESKNYSAIADNLHQYEHRNFLNKIRDGIKNIIQTSPIFAPARAIVSAVQKFKSKKDSELKMWIETKRTNENSQEKDNSGYSRS